MNSGFIPFYYNIRNMVRIIFEMHTFGAFIIVILSASYHVATWLFNQVTTASFRSSSFAKRLAARYSIFGKRKKSNVARSGLWQGPRANCMRKRFNITLNIRHQWSAATKQVRGLNAQTFYNFMDGPRIYSRRRKFLPIIYRYVSFGRYL